MATTTGANSTRANRTIVRDIKFSMTLVLLNVVFVTFKLPVIIYVSVKADRSSLWFSILDDLYYSCYAVNFFIYLGVNSIFCDEFLEMCGIRKKSPLEKYTVS